MTLADGAASSLHEAPQQGPPKRRLQRALLAVKRNGVVYLFSYGLISHVNLALMFGAAWALYVRNWGVCPISPRPGFSQVVAITLAFYQPTLLQPTFLAFYGAMCLSVGSLTRPVRAGMAAAIMPGTRCCLRFFQDHLLFPRIPAYALTLMTGFLAANCTFAPAVLLSCALLSVPAMGS